MRSAFRNSLLVVLAVGLTGCGIFGSKDEALKPAELIEFDSKLDVRRIWSARVGDKAEFLRLALRPAGDGNRVYAASRDGDVVAFNAESGQEVWRTELDIALSAGPGVGGGLVAVVAQDGIVIVLDAGDGTERWRSDVGGESLARPAISDDAVIVQTVDNRLRALASFDGTEQWVIVQSMPRLTVRGSAAPQILGSSVIAGFDNGRLVSVDIDTGTIEWEALLAPPSGRSDLERLSDIDGEMAIVGRDIYAAGYQGRIAAVAAESGQLIWAADISSLTGVSADWTTLYTSTDNGVLIALSRRNGAETWRQDALLRREPTRPVPFSTAVVVGDFDGYLHFFSNVDGEPVARVRADGAAVSADPLSMGGRLFVQSDGGTLSAYAVRQPRRAPDIADEDS